MEYALLNNILSDSDSAGDYSIQPTNATSDDISSDNEDDIVPMTCSDLEEPLLVLPLLNWCARRCDLVKDLNDPASEDGNFHGIKI